MRVDGGITVEWSWQTLEKRHAPTYFVIDDDVTYKVTGGEKGDSRKFENQHDMLSVVLEYLESEGVRARNWVNWLRAWLPR